MRLVPFVLDDNTVVAINPEHVDAVKTIGSRTRIFVGDFYTDVIESVYDVCEILQSKNAKNNERGGEQE